MKNYFIISILFFSIFIKAQCDHSPEITSPRLHKLEDNVLLFCKFEQEIISTTESYDAYTWYKKYDEIDSEWIRIDGETSQSLTLFGRNEDVYYYKVAATLNGCTEESPVIFVAHHLHLLPYGIVDLPDKTLYQRVGPSEYDICEGAEVTFTQGTHETYNTPIWLKCYPDANDYPPEKGDPCVIDVDTDYYVATTSGIYDFYACVTYCPDDYCYLNGGWTKLNFDNWDWCPNLGVKDTEAKNTLPLYPNPSIQFIYFGMTDTLFKTIEFYDITGKKVLEMNNFESTNPINISHLPSGTYIIKAINEESKILKNKFIKN